MSANRYEEALADSKAAEEIDPSNVKVLHRLARIYCSLGRPADALDVLSRLSSMKPVSASDRAQAEQMQLHLAQAETVLREGTAGSMAIHALDQDRKSVV